MAEENGDGPLEKLRRIGNENVNITQTNGSFSTKSHAVATNDPIQRYYSYLNPKTIVEIVGLHTKTISL